MPTGVSITRFSTWPDWVTVTTSARPGPRLTNSMCFSGCSVLGAMTTPAQRDRPDNSVVACSSASVTLRPTVRAARLDALALVLGEVADFQQAVDEQAQPGIGRQAAGRGVRGVEQAEVLQVGHDVADGGGRQGLGELAGQRPRAHRLAGLDIALDDVPQHLARALVQLGDRSPSVAGPAGGR